MFLYKVDNARRVPSLRHPDGTWLGSGYFVNDMIMYITLNLSGDVFAAPGNVGNTFSTRLRARFRATETGLHTFYIKADDYGVLRLSENEIATCPGATNTYNKFPSQRSTAIYLEKGIDYYIEAIGLEATGGDHLDVGIQYPSNKKIVPISVRKHLKVPLDMVNVALIEDPGIWAFFRNFDLFQGFISVEDAENASLILDGRQNVLEEHDRLIGLILFGLSHCSSMLRNEIWFLSLDSLHTDELKYTIRLPAGASPSTSIRRRWIGYEWGSYTWYEYNS